jgi:hypothetical protein
VVVADPLFLKALAAADPAGYRLGCLDHVVVCLGAHSMRGAGCTWNDIAGPQFDAAVSKWTKAARSCRAGRASSADLMSPGDLWLDDDSAYVQQVAIVLGIASGLVAFIPSQTLHTGRKCFGSCQLGGPLVAWAAHW